MQFAVSTNPEELKDTGGSDYINQSGIYDVNLNYVQVAATKNKAYQLNFNVTNGGMEQTIFGPILVNTDGNLNAITKSLLNRLCIVAGMGDGHIIETETVEMPVGKDRKLMEMEIIPELSDIPVKIRVQMEYSLYNNNIQERKAVKAFYREDGATAAEAQSGEDIGKRLALDEEKYASNVTYKDGLTETDVKEWIQVRMSNSANRSVAAAVPKATAQRPRFGK